MAELLSYLERAVKDGASDLFFVAGGPVSEKLDNRLVRLGEERLSTEASEDLIQEIYAQAGRDMENFRRIGDDDFSFSVKHLARFRVNAYRQRGSMAAVVRVVSFDIPDWQSMGIPPQVMELSKLTHGMILVTGRAGSGKSTTQACLVDRINQTRECHIISLEDPIEYLHRNQKSIVSQREIAIDTEDYHSALRACLRQAPDVILLGELRDQETIHTAMTAAETGHLLIATLHTRDAASTIERIVDTFSGTTQQEQVRAHLCMALQTVISQQLLPGTDGNLMPAFEIMHMTTGIQGLIRSGKLEQIDNQISSGTNEGMISMDRSIAALCKAGKITAETAVAFAKNKDWMSRTGVAGR